MKGYLSAILTRMSKTRMDGTYKVDRHVVVRRNVHLALDGQEVVALAFGLELARELLG